MGTTILKLEGTGGDLKEMSSTDENYSAYLMGLRLSELYAASSTGTSNLALTTGMFGGTNIGSFSDTVYDQNVGDHGSLTVTTTTTTLYQQNPGFGGIVDLDDDYRPAVEFVDNSGEPEIHELSDSEMITLTERLISRVMTSEYPGTFRLGTSSPSGDYATHISNVFSDTRTDGSSTAYNVYRRQTMSAPTAVRPVHIKRSGGKSGAFQGLQEMTDAEIKYTFGDFKGEAGGGAAPRIMASKIGTYQLRSSAQGAPTDTGTWAARGTATDTRNAVADTDYSANYEGNYQSEFTADYTGEFTTTYGSVFTGDFVGNYTGDFAREFTADFSRTFTGNFTGNFDRIFTGTFTGNFVRDFTGNFLRDFTAAFAREFEGNFLRDFVGNFSREFVREFEGNFAREFTGNFTRDFTGAFDRNFTADYTGDFERDFIGDFQGDFTGQFEGNFTGNFERNFQVSYFRDFNRNFTVDYFGTFTRDFTGDFTGDFQREFVRTYTGNFQREFVRTYTGNFDRNFVRTYTGNFTRDFTGTYTGNFIGTTPQNYTRDYNLLQGSQYQLNISSRGSLTGFVVKAAGTLFYHGSTRGTHYLIYWNGQVIWEFVDDGTVSLQHPAVRFPSGVTSEVGSANYRAAPGTDYNEGLSIYVGRTQGRIFPVAQTALITGYMRTQTSGGEPMYTGPGGVYIRHYSLYAPNRAGEQGVFAGPGAPHEGVKDYQTTSGFASGSSFTGNFTRTFTGDFAGNFTGVSPSGNYVYGPIANAPAAPRLATRAGTFVGGGSPLNYTRSSLRSSNVSSTRSSGTVVNYLPDFTSFREGYVAGTGYIGDFVPTYTGNFAGTVPQNYTRSANETYGASYATDFNTSSNVGYATNFNTSSNVTSTTNFNTSSNVTSTQNSTSVSVRNFESNYISDFITTFFLGNTVQDFAGAGTTGVSTRNQDTSFIGANSTVTSTDNYTAVSTRTFDSEFTTDFTQNFTTDSTVTSAGNSTINSVVESTSTYTSDFTTVSVSEFERAYTSDFTTVFTTESTADSTTDSTGSSTRDSQRNTDQIFTREFQSIYTRDSQRNTTVDSGASRDSNFSRISTRDFVAEFVGDYVGNYVGSEIQASGTTIETYTLYVRTA